MPTPLRLIFMGTPYAAVPTLETLLALPEAQVVAAVTGPDRPAGCGRPAKRPANGLSLLTACPWLRRRRVLEGTRRGRGQFVSWHQRLAST